MEKVFSGKEKKTSPDGSKGKISLWPEFKASRVLLYAVAAFILLLPYIIVFYPGIMEIDTIFQIAEHLGYGDGRTGEGTWTSLFPVFCARFYGTLFQIGTAVGGGDQNSGILALTLFQTVGLSLSMSALCCYLRKWNVPAPACLAVLLVTLLVPVLPHQAVNIGKDGLFTIVFIAYMICFMEVIRTKGACLQGGMRWIVASMLFASLLSLSRSTGIYVVGICTVAALAFTCRNLRNLVFQAIPVCVAAVATFTMSMYTSSLGATSLGYQEILGTPMQQTAQYLREGGEVDDAEFESLDRFYDVQAALDTFEPQMTDNVKSKHRKDANKSDLASFLATYFKLGMKHPGSYWRAWYALYSGYIEVGTFDSLATVRFLPAVPLEELGIKYSDGMDWPDDLDKMLEFIEDDKVIYAQVLLPEYKDAHPEFGTWKGSEPDDAARKGFFGILFAWAKIPVLNLLVSKSLYVTYLPLLLLIASLASANRKKLIPVLVPMICVTLLAFVSPVDFTRYILPEIAVDFALVALVFSNIRKKPEDKQANPAVS